MSVLAVFIAPSRSLSGFLCVSLCRSLCQMHKHTQNIRNYRVMLCVWLINLFQNEPWKTNVDEILSLFMEGQFNLNDVLHGHQPAFLLTGLRNEKARHSYKIICEDLGVCGFHSIVTIGTKVANKKHLRMLTVFKPNRVIWEKE